MAFKLSPLLILVSLSLFSNAQISNLVRNGGMESPSGSDSPRDCGMVDSRRLNTDNTGNKPCKLEGPYDGLSTWEDRLKKKKVVNHTKQEEDQGICDEYVLLHSPDWYSFGNSPISKFRLVDDPPLEGDAYVGLGTCELIQQQLITTQRLENNTEYKISIWIRLVTAVVPGCATSPFTKDAKIQVHLSKDKFRYGHGADLEKNHCKSKYCNKSNGTINADKIKVIDETLNLSKYPSGSWHQITGTFTSPATFAHQYNWFVIEVLPLNNADMCSSYTLVDNVVLATPCVVGCDNGCSRTDGAINVTINNVMGGTQAFEISGLTNAVKAHFQIFSNPAGQNPIYTSPVYECTNGILQTIQWGGLGVANGVYYYKVFVDNDCGEDCPITGTLIKTNDFTGTLDPFICYDGPIKVPDPCCPLEPDIYIDNVTFPSTQNFTDGFTFDYEAQNDINVATTGNVTVQAGAEVTFQAGNSINITTNNYDEELGAEVSKIIVPCPQGKMNYTGNDLNGMEPDSLVAPTVTRHIDLEEPVDKEPGRDDDALSDDPDSMIMKVYPNPSNGRWFKTYLVNVSGKLKIEVIDGLGVARQIDQVNRSSPDHSTFTCTISGDPLSSGIYTVRISGGEEVVLGKLVVVR